MDGQTNVLVPGVLEPMAAQVTSMLEARGFTPCNLGPVTESDIECGYAHIDNDVCVSAVATVGQYIRALREHDGEVAVLVFELCRDCRSISLPDVMESAFRRAGLGDVPTVALTDADLRTCAHEREVALAATSEPATAEGSAGVIGLCGTVPVITTGAFCRTVVDYLEQAGIRVVMPPLDALVGERDAITPALRYFARAEIGTVICIVPFGCMGGHVYARGQLRKLIKEYPDLSVTVLDYDPSASDMNVVNRTELIIQSAKEAALQRGV